MKTTPNHDDKAMRVARQVVAAALALLLISALIPTKAETVDLTDAQWPGHTVILDDPAYFMPDEEESIPVITSVGKSNVKVNGVKSRNKLVRYTVPEQLLANDESFLRLMIEAEKYIGYPYVYGGSSPKTGFDCSGLVYYVYQQFGYELNRTAAEQAGNGSHVEADALEPGDVLCFYKGGTIGHSGIYIGDGNYVHAQDSATGVVISPLSERKGGFEARRILK